MISDRWIDVGTLLSFESEKFNSNSKFEVEAISFEKKMIQEGVFSDYEIYIRQGNDNNNVMGALEFLSQFDTSRSSNYRKIVYPYLSTRGVAIDETYVLKMRILHDQLVSDVTLTNDPTNQIYVTVIPVRISATLVDSLQITK